MSTLTTSDRATHQTNGHSPGTNGFEPPAPKKRKRGNGRRVAVLGGVAVLLVAGAAGAFYVLDANAGAAGGDVLTYEVSREPLVVSVVETGTIKAADQAVIKNEIEGRTAILTLVPEGQAVEKDDLLVELDVSALQDEKVDREIAVQNAEAAAVQAEEGLAVAKNQALSDVDAAKLAYQFAKEDIEKYLQGDYPKELKTAENRITIAKEEFERAKAKREGSEKLLGKNFVSQTDFDADVLAEKKARLDMELAEQELTLLTDWDRTRKLNEFESDVEQTEMALERARRKASADVVKAEADLRAKQAELSRQRDKLAKTLDQISKAKIFAPSDGMVVYASSAEGGWRGNEEPLEAGQEVRERQDLIYLPTPDDRIAEVKIHESSLDKVRMGLPARVTVDALPGRTFWGKVVKIAPLPDATMVWLNPDLKVYSTEILIPGINEALKTGMSCRAEIVVETYDEALAVPVQSVVRVGGVPSVFLIGPDGQPVAREVEVGMDNNSKVVIKGGLEAGDRVMLAPPLEQTGTGGAAMRMKDVPDDQRDAARQAAEENAPAAEQAAEAAEAQEKQPSREEVMRKVRNAMNVVNAKATDEEKAKLKAYRDGGDWQGMGTYSRELATKYGVEMPDMSAAFGGGGGGGNRGGGERGGQQGEGR